MFPPALPNFLGEATTDLGRCLVNDEAARVARASLVLDRSGNVLRQGLGTWVKLARAPSSARLRHRQP